MEHGYSVVELDDCIAQLVEAADLQDFFFAKSEGGLGYANLYDAIRDRLSGMGINVVVGDATSNTSKSLVDQPGHIHAGCGLDCKAHMSAQRYSTVAAFERMEQGLCPECGREPDVHSMERDFWIRPG